MIPAARAQSVIDLLEEVFERRKVPADTLLHDYCRSRRYMGSGDRQAISKMFYDILRMMPRLQWHLSNPTPRLLFLAYLKLTDRSNEAERLFNGERFSPDPMRSAERSFFQMPTVEEPDYVQAWMPAWIFEKLKKYTPEQLQKLNDNAPLDMRVHPERATHEEALVYFKQNGYEAQPMPWSPYGIRFPRRINFDTLPWIKEGKLEIQDEGSQLIALLCDVKPGIQVLDYCAGAGGKGLLMGALMHNKGRLLLSDTSAKRLQRARQRFAKSGIQNVEFDPIEDTWHLRQRIPFDRILLDVPCSGSGTWRRNPDLKFRVQESDLKELRPIQQGILEAVVPHLKKNGRIIYATCSLFEEENEQQIQTFLENHPEFELVPIRSIWEKVLDIPCPFEDFLKLTPWEHYTDGFFAAVLQKR